jgi:hypothetical protein
VYSKGSGEGIERGRNVETGEERKAKGKKRENGRKEGM